MLAGAADEGDEVLACHAGGVLGHFDELGVSQVGAVGQDAVHAAGGAKFLGEGAGVDAVEAQHAGLGEVIVQGVGGAVIGVQAGEFADDEACDLDFFAFDVLGVDARVADEREGLRENLAGVRRISQAFLIAAHGGVEDDFGTRNELFADGTKGVARENGAVSKCESARYARKFLVHQSGF